MLKVIFKTCLLLFSFFLSTEILFAKEQPLKITIAISENILSIYKDWTNNQACWEVTEFEAAHSNRGAAELIILCKALHMGALEFYFDINQTPNYGRSLLLTQQQKVHLQGETVWLDQADNERFYISEPLLKKGEIIKGAYTLKYHSMMESVKEAKELSHYRGITMPSWHHDWNALRQLTKNILASPTPNSIHKMIKKGRADFTLGEFNNRMSILLGDVYLYPIPNIKIVINQSRHIAVRKGMPNSLEIITAINKGLIEMRKSGLITNIYKHTGTLNPKITNWKLFDPET